MNPGALRHTVTLQTRTATVDAGGGRVETWTDAYTVRADIEPLTGAERIAAMQVNPGLSHRVRIRYRAGITSATRLLYGARVFEVRAVLDTGERHRELILLCEERAA